MKAELSDTVRLLVEMVALLAGAKVNRPLVMSRVDENPFTTTVTPPGVCDKVTFETNGTVARFVSVADGGGLGVTFVPATVMLLMVSVIVPATVPVSSGMLELPENCACVVPAGMMKSGFHYKVI